MQIQELQFTCEQISQRMNSPPATIIRELLPEEISHERLPSRIPVDPSEVHNSLQLDHGKNQDLPLDISYDHSETEDKPSSSILKSPISSDQGKIFGYTSSLLINRARKYD